MPTRPKPYVSIKVRREVRDVIDDIAKSEGISRMAAVEACAKCLKESGNFDWEEFKEGRKIKQRERRPKVGEIKSAIEAAIEENPRWGPTRIAKEVGCSERQADTYGNFAFERMCVQYVKHPRITPSSLAMKADVTEKNARSFLHKVNGELRIPVDQRRIFRKYKIKARPYSKTRDAYLKHKGE